jgi:uncharacterized protein RhaS with RHS repeats
MYDPSIGRWIQEDPEGFDAGDANLYRFVNNNPTILTDPTGLEAKPYRGWKVEYKPDDMPYRLGDLGSVAIYQTCQPRRTTRR